MVVINQNSVNNSGDYKSPEVNIDSNLKRWFSRNVGLWKSNRTYFLEEEKKTYKEAYYDKENKMLRKSIHKMQDICFGLYIFLAVLVNDSSSSA